MRVKRKNCNESVIRNVPIAKLKAVGYNANYIFFFFHSGRSMVVKNFKFVDKKTFATIDIEEVGLRSILAVDLPLYTKSNSKWKRIP